MDIETVSMPSVSSIVVEEEAANTARSYRLEDLYEHRDREEIAHYLQSYPRLIDFLHESYGHLLKLFGASTRFALEVVRDPEAQYKQLIVYINTSLPVDAALNRMDRLDREWFLDHFKSIGHRINFNLEIA